MPFTPIPDLQFVRDPNLRHLLGSIRTNLRAAYNLTGEGFATKAELAAVAGRAAASSSTTATAGTAVISRMVSCVYDISTGVGGEGPHYLNAVLPANMLLVRAFCYVLESFTGDPGVLLSIRAGDGADEFDVFPDSALASDWAEGYHASINIGQSAGARARAFKAIVTGGSISAGKLRFYAEYVTCEA